MMTIIVIIISDVGKTKQRKCNEAYKRDSKEGSVGWWDATCGMPRTEG